MRRAGYAGGPRVGQMPMAVPPFAVRGAGPDRGGDEIRGGRRGRGVDHDSRQVPEVAGIAVRVAGGLHVGLVLVESEACRHEREHDEQGRSHCRGPRRRHHASIQEAKRAGVKRVRPHRLLTPRGRLCIAIAKEADALLLDEPTSGLDPQASNEFSELLGRLGERGVAVLMATHDLFRAKETGTRVGIMRHGRLVTEMSTDEIGHADLERIYLEHMHG